MSLSTASVLAPRPGYNTAAQRRSVIANHLPLSFNASQVVYQYDVTFKVTPSRKDATEEEQGDRPRPHLVKSNIEFWITLIKERGRDLPKNMVFDGVKIAYSATRMPKQPAVFEIELSPAIGDRPPRVLHAAIKESVPCNINLMCLQNYFNGNSALTGEVFRAKQALDVILAHKSRLGHVYTASGVFKANDRDQKMISGGFGLRVGITQTTYLAAKNLTVNVDVSHRAFYPDIPLFEFIRHQVPEVTDRNFNGLRSFDKERLQSLIRGLKLRATHLNKTGKGGAPSRPTFVIAQSLGRLPRLETFTRNKKDKSTEETDVQKYYATCHNVIIQHPNLPVVVDKRKNCYPVECLVIEPNQPMRGQFNEQQLAEVITIAARPPSERMQRIQRLCHDMLDFQKDEFLSTFKVSVRPDFCRVEGHMLPSPALEYGSSNPREAGNGVGTSLVQPNFGSWNLMKVSMFCGARLNSAGCVIVSPARKSECEYFFGEFVRLATQTYGMKIDNARDFPFRQAAQAGDLIKTLTDTYESARKACGTPPQLLFVFLQRRSVDLYVAIKAYCETSLGVPTQVLLTEKCGRAKPQYTANVILKVNMKMNEPRGINLRLKHYPAGFDSAPTMVVGIDVNHSPRGTSIAAFVASCDRYVARYSSGVVELGPRQEILSEGKCKEVFKKLLTSFKNRNGGRAPVRVIVYRDGVSDGEFMAVKEIELEEMREAARELGLERVPTFTVIICKKRHHTRLAPLTDRDGDKSRNVPAGFVADRGIVNENCWEFFLQSQSGLQGTSRPTRYHVLVDENGFNAQGLEELTFGFAHLYARATRSVGIVAPTYYAHLACARARLYFRGSAVDPAQPALAQLSSNLTDVMYYL